MTTNWHTAISVGAIANAATWNTPLGALDEAITNAQAGVYNVLEYGASSGGDAATNATAFQAAIDAAESAGGTVVVPKGTYEISTGLVVGADNVHIRGAGHGSIIQTTGTVAIAIDLSGQETCSVSHLSIYTATSVNPWKGIYLGPGAWRNYIEDVYIHADSVHTGQAGVTFAADGSLGSYWNTLVHVVTLYLDVGFDFTVGTLQCNDNHLIACQARDGNTGIRLGTTGAANGNHIVACTCDGHDTVGIEVGANSVGNVVQGCYLEGDAGSVPVDFKSGCRDNSFAGLILASTTGLNTITDNGTRNSWDAVVIDSTDAATYTERRDNRRLVKALLQPIANAGEILQICNAAGTTYLDFSTNATPRLEMPNGPNFIIYSDGFSTVKFSVSGSTGDIRTAGNLGVGNSASATTPGNVTKKIQVYDAAGNSIGYLAVYDAIT